LGHELTQTRPRGADPLRLDADGNAILDAARRMGAGDTAELLAAVTSER